MASAKIIELDESNTCKICDNALAKYSCPKCNIIYCSLACYQSSTHVECSENFYKENIMTELNLEPNHPDSRAKMLEILERNQLPTPSHYEANGWDSDVDLDDIGPSPYSQFVDVENLEEDLDSDDDDEYVDIATRLAGIDLDDPETVWDNLTEDERQDFVAFLKSDHAAEAIPSWQPWWTYHDNKKVTDLSGAEDFKKDCPNIGQVKDFANVTTKTPANCVKYNLINLLAAYAFTARYFNGDHFLFPNEAVATIAATSHALKKGENFEDYETALKSVEQECINNDWIRTDSENLDLMRVDVEDILKGPNSTEKSYYVLCALSDFQKLLRACQSPKKETTGNFSKLFPSNHFPEVKHETKDKIKKYLKKLDYFQSYAKDVLNL